MIFRIPKDRINWTTSSFLIGTFFLTLTAVPLYLWHFGIDWFHVAVFAVLLVATGFSITLGCHPFVLAPDFPGQATSAPVHAHLRRRSV